MNNLIVELEQFERSDLWEKAKGYIRKRIEATENVRDNPDTPDRLSMVELGKKLAFQEILTLTVDLKRLIISEIKKEEQKHEPQEPSGRE